MCVFFFLAFCRPVIGGVQVWGVKPGGSAQRHSVRRGAGYERDGPLRGGRRVAINWRRQVRVRRVPEEPVGQLCVALLRVACGQRDRMADGWLLALRPGWPAQDFHQREYNIIIIIISSVIIIPSIKGWKDVSDILIKETKKHLTNVLFCFVLQQKYPEHKWPISNETVTYNF